MKQKIKALLKTVNYWFFPEKPKEFLKFFSELFNEVPDDMMVAKKRRELKLLKELQEKYKGEKV